MEDDRTSRLRAAVREYFYKRGRGIELRANLDGWYEPPSDDVCPACLGALWSTRTGAHLKTTKHISRKWRVSENALIKSITLNELTDKSTDVGYKSLSWNPETYKLCSPSYADFIWEPGVVMEARLCYQCQDEGGPRPEDGCGIYGYWSADEARNYQSGNVVVRMQIGGVVVEHEIGFRTQYATITGILNQGQEIDYIMSETYGVPLVSGEETKDDYEVWEG